MTRWSRRTFQSRVLAGLAGLAATPMGCRRGAERAPGRPIPQGVVVITADDLGWRDVGAYGLSSVATPAIDRLVNEGVAFDHAFDVVSTCSSSRASMVTGQYPHTHGVTGLTHRHPELSLPADHPTSVRTLWDQGVITAVQGKWHLSATAQPEAFAYDRYLDTDLDQRIRRTEDVLDFLHAAGDAPFYLELNYMQTHRDLVGDFPQIEGFEVSVDDAPVPEWWGLPDWPEIREEVAGYLSGLRWMDSLIGEVLTGLDDRGLTDDTLVVFLSDNGPAFPGCKLTLYDRGTGTPLMFRWPAGLKPRWEDELVSTVQLAPTLLELVGAPPLATAQGRSIAPLLLGESWEPTQILFSEMEMHSSSKPARAARTRTHKYIRNLTDDPWGDGGGDAAYKGPLADEPDQRWDEPRPYEELYDLVDDPVERLNLVDDPAYAGVLAELRAQLDAHMQATDDPRLGE